MNPPESDPAPRSDPEHDVLGDIREVLQTQGQSLVVEDEFAHRKPPPSVQRKISEAVAKLGEARNVASALDTIGRQTPAPNADAHTRPYRRGGKIRKRDMAKLNAANADRLTAVREYHQSRRRAQRAAR